MGTVFKVGDRVRATRALDDGSPQSDLVKQRIGCTGVVEEVSKYLVLVRFDDELRVHCERPELELVTDDQAN